MIKHYTGNFGSQCSNLRSFGRGIGITTVISENIFWVAFKVHSQWWCSVCVWNISLLPPIGYWSTQRSICCVLRSHSTFSMKSTKNLILASKLDITRSGSIRYLILEIFWVNFKPLFCPYEIFKGSSLAEVRVTLAVSVCWGPWVEMCRYIDQAVSLTITFLCWYSRVILVTLWL